MASGTSPGEVRVWDVASGLVMYMLPYTSPVNAVAYAPVGDTLAASTVQSRVLVWSAAAGASLRTLAPPRTTGGLCLAFGPKGGVLATGGGDLAGGQFPGEARLWDVKSGRLLRTLPHPHRSVVSLQFVPGSGDCLVASRGLGADSQGSLDLWDKSLKTHRWTRVAPDLIGAALVAGGASVASVQSEVAGKQYLLRVRLWNGKNGTAQSGYRAPMGGWAISPSGGLLACSGADRKSIAVRDVRTGRLLHRLECSYPPASLSFAFSTDSRMLAAGTQDGSVLLWTLK
ncbi:MAG: serine/threonine protein kinase with repeat [Capsulimonas sp.]|nr:serine/threonine protein kinase with repeat [Capsulimonas sp.]